MSLSSIAQNNQSIEILNADNTYSNTNLHPEYWRLIGNVSFKHNNAIMNCDSAYHYTSDDKMKAFGKIKITQGDSIILTGNKLTYFGNENKANIEGEVILIDNHMTLKTQQIFYNLNNNIASYPNTGNITDNEKKITSKKGDYYSDIHKFIFTDSVKVIAKDYKILTNNMHYNSNSETTYFFGPSYIISENKIIYCENGWYNTKNDLAQLLENTYITINENIITCDSLFYNKNLGYSKAINNIRMRDTVQNITVSGDLAEYFEFKEEIIVSKKPILELLFEKDTLFMKAKRFVSQLRVDKKKVLAYNKVKFFKSDFQGKCDSLSYNLNDSLVEMYNNPILWSNQFQITADSLKFLLKKGNISKVLLEPNPMIISKEDSLDYNQIKGKNITAFFTNNKMRRMDVEGNGQSIFIVIDEKKNKKIGLNYTECSDLILYFKENKLDAINYKMKPNSITTPYKDIKEEDRLLKGFHWRGLEKPNKKADILN